MLGHEFARCYRKFDAFPIAQKIYRHFQTRNKGKLEPGDEYMLVDECAEMLGVRDWYPPPAGVVARRIPPN